MKNTRLNLIAWCVLGGMGAADLLALSVHGASGSEIAPAPAPKAGIASIKVLDAGSHQPLAGVRVAIQAIGTSDAIDFAGTTGASGSVVFRGLPAGRYLATATNGSTSARARFDISADSPSARLALFLDPAID